MSITFYIAHYSPVPYHAQINDQIKSALLLGWLRPGDMLPSIRDLEKETGISRNIIRRAYVELEQQGILKLTHGKGVRVVEDLKYPSDSAFVKRCEKLCKETLERGEKLGLLGSAFARLLYQMAIQEEQTAQRFYYVDMTQALAQERAQQLSVSWQLQIDSATVEELPEILQAANGSRLRIFTNHFRYGEVSSLISSADDQVQVVAIALRFSEVMKEKMQLLPKGSSVIIFLSERDFASYGGVILAEYEQHFPRWIHFKVAAVKDLKDVRQRTRGDQYNLIVLSNRLWESAPSEVKKNALFTHPQLEIDVRSAEEARISAGILV